MTAQTFPAARPGRARPLERALAVRIPFNVEVALYVAIFAAAFALRFWDLGSRALHHDESIHAQWSWRLLQGDYKHSPIFHGPFYYHVQAAFFFVFGASDYTSRMSAAVFGSGIVALPLLLRRWLGPVGTMAAVAFLAFSPTVVYYSRFFREDIYMAFFVLLMVCAMWRYVAEGRNRWLVVFALAFTGAITTKEGTFLTVAVFLLFLDLYVASIFARRMLTAREIDSPVRRFIVTGAYAPWAWLLVALWPLAGRLRRSLDLGERLPRAGDLLVLLGTITVPLLTPILRSPLEYFGIVGDVRLADGTLVPRLEWERHLSTSAITTSDRMALAGLFALSCSAAGFVGLNWKPKLWGITAGVCAVIYLTLMTSLWTNLDGLVSGPWGSLDYWREQQNVYRGDQPWFYYFLVMPSYEFLPLIVAIGGVWWTLFRGNAFSRFLWFWLIGQWLALSYGSEKMPWLNTHLAVPACILAAVTLQRAWQAWDPKPQVSRAAATLAAVAAIALAAMLLLVYLPDTAAANVSRIAIAVLAVGASAWIVRPALPSGAGIALAAIAVGGLSFFSIRTMSDASFERADVPKDMLIYTQSSPDIPKLMKAIDDLAAASGKGLYLPIAVDAADSFAWPWAWYLRDYKCVAYPDMKSGNIGLSNCQGVQQPYAVLLVNSSNNAKVTDSIAQAGGAEYGSPIRYPHRWWFDEIYKNAMSTNGSLCLAQSGDCGPFHVATWETIAEGVFQRGWIKDWYSYWKDHDPDELVGATPPAGRECGSCGSVDGIAYFPAAFDMNTGKLNAGPVPPVEPGVDAEGHPFFGGAGVRPGQFLAPVDIDRDAAGNLYVIDSATRKIQKFDPQGHLLASADIRINPANTNEPTEPWGLTVAPDGKVFVADTFGWRIRVFDADLKPTGLTFGEQPKLEKGVAPGPYELFGPRDAIVDAHGQLWVTDTGHDRIVIYTEDGQFVRAVGSEGAGDGQFNEPVGIAQAPDGTIYVADMFNSRVAVLDASGAWKGSFAVEGWGGRTVDDKPYLRVLADGRLAIGLPSLNQVRIYTADGHSAGAITGGAEPLSHPYGLLEAGDGKLWIVEGGSGRVRQFPIP